ncbi:MAG TPA: hypothetical protein VK882_03620, partial [Nitrososphaeraceae archaeon]|nr:hypothetical protein [Nitrososphaeraceae archaeon]
SDLQFIKGVIGINSASSEGDVVENLIKMFKQKKIGQLSLGKDIRIPLDSEDMVTFFKDKETEKTIKDMNIRSTRNNILLIIMSSTWILLAN